MIKIDRYTIHVNTEPVNTLTYTLSHIDEYVRWVVFNWINSFHAYSGIQNCFHFNAIYSKCLFAINLHKRKCDQKY